VLEAEKAKAEQDAANKAEAKKLQEDMEGDPEEEEEDLTPGTPVKMMLKLPKDLPKLPESVLGGVCSPRLSSTTSRTRNSSSLT